MHHAIDPVRGASHRIDVANAALNIIDIIGPIGSRGDIEHAHGFACIEKGAHHMRAEKSGTTGDEDLRLCHFLGFLTIDGRNKQMSNLENVAAGSQQTPRGASVIRVANGCWWKRRKNERVAFRPTSIQFKCVFVVQFQRGILIRLSQVRVAHRQAFNFAPHKTAERIGRCAYDRLAAHIE